VDWDWDEAVVVLWDEVDCDWDEVVVVVCDKDDEVVVVECVWDSVVRLLVMLFG
jgi:hypothetical protein